MRSIFGSTSPKAAVHPAGMKPAEGTNSARRDRVISLNASGDPIQELDRITDAAASPEMHANLSQLRSLLEDRNRAAALQRERTRENALRSLLYQAESLRNTAFRYWVLNNELEKLKKNNLPAEKQKPMTDAMKDIFSGLRTALSFYRTGAESLAAAPAASTKRLFSQLRSEYQGDDVFNTHMRENLNIAEKHISLAREKKLDATSDKTLFKELIPAVHFSVLKF